MAFNQADALRHLETGLRKGMIGEAELLDAARSAATQGYVPGTFNPLYAPAVRSLAEQAGEGALGLTQGVITSYREHQTPRGTGVTKIIKHA